MKINFPAETAMAKHFATLRFYLGLLVENCLETGPGAAILTRKRSHMRWRRQSALDVYTGSFGLFLFVSPWLFAFAGKVARIDVWASGAAIAAVSIAALVAFSDWEEWLNLLLGVWLTVSPWVLGFTHTKAMHVSIGLGAMVAFVAGLELWLVKYDPQYSSG
jgi:hypothetical protein